LPIIPGVAEEHVSKVRLRDREVLYFFPNRRKRQNLFRRVPNT
jgi:hypothetical protein